MEELNENQRLMATNQQQVELQNLVEHRKSQEN